MKTLPEIKMHNGGLLVPALWRGEVHLCLKTLYSEELFGKSVTLRNQCRVHRFAAPYVFMGDETWRIAAGQNSEVMRLLQEQHGYTPVHASEDLLLGILRLWREEDAVVVSGHLVGHLDVLMYEQLLIPHPTKEYFLITGVGENLLGFTETRKLLQVAEGDTYIYHEVHPDVVRVIHSAYTDSGFDLLRKELDPYIDRGQAPFSGVKKAH